MVSFKSEPLNALFQSLITCVSGVHAKPAPPRLHTWTPWDTRLVSNRLGAANKYVCRVCVRNGSGPFTHGYRLMRNLHRVSFTRAWCVVT